MNHRFTSILIMVTFVTSPMVSFANPGSPAPQPLKQLLSITWKLGPHLPQGFQDSKGGVVHDTLITVGGFCSGQKNVPGKEAKYPRGFLNKAWGISLNEKNAPWQELPEFPGLPRQGLDAVALNDSLYCFGGFNYTAPFSYRDGYRLSKTQNQWKWQALPDLPWTVAGHGSCVIDSVIYVLGGADYDETRFHTNRDRTGMVKRLGARLVALDTRDLKAGWRERSACPGTPRFVHAVAAVGNKLYVFGGAASVDDKTGATCTVVDNWCYESKTDRWRRLADLPIASGNFPAGAIVYDQRYILLIGGYQYGGVMDLNGKMRPVYGSPTRHYPKNSMCSDVFVFDVQSENFGKATPLPLNNNLPMTVVYGNRIHLLGGEIDSAEIDGHRFGHHPDLYLIGTIERK